MRKLLLLTICLVMAIVSRAQTSLYDFTAVHDGVTYYCNIKDATNRKVMLVKFPYTATFPSVQTLIVPEKLTAPDGIEYTVTGLSDFWLAYFNTFPNVEEIILPKTLEHVENFAIGVKSPLKKLTFQALQTYDAVGVFGGTSDGYFIEEIRMLMETPPTNTNGAYGFFDLRGQKDRPFRIFVPLECTYRYKADIFFKYHTKQYDLLPNYYEELKIGPNGYTSYYLEHENFEVPTGSTAYIIKGATNRLNHTGDAVVEAFPAGSIIPKQTGFILSGTAGSTVAYRACVDGPEVDVTGNLLVGTATEQEFSGAGYKYYIFGNGSEGQGFYHQGTRKGNSMKVGAHRAGLKLPTTGFSPAKPFVFNFEEAVRNTVTGISTVKTESAAKDAPIYNLQGCRVTNPTNGIYIVNGKKVLIKK
ncbi:MAG: hypothetical protein HG466_002535 [Prevotella sp.]|nr:hypothetical protein [Prevotella sp.]